MDWQKTLGWSEETMQEMRIAGFSFLREGLYEKALLFFQALVGA